MEEYYPKIGVCYDNISNLEKIFLLYTYRCNASCSHCLTESNPLRKEKMTLEMAKRIIGEGGKFGKRWLMISGGEPFLYYREVLDLVEFASLRGYFCCVGTNGFWATDYVTAERHIEKLKRAGLRAVFPSASAYHSPFVPTERIAVIDKVCADLGVACEVNFYPSPQLDEDQRIRSMLGLDHKTWYTDGLILSGNDVTALKDVFAKRLPSELDDCGSVHFAVTPRADVICNCNVTYRCSEFYGTPFYLGNLNQMSIKDALRAERVSPVLNVLMTARSGLIHELLSECPAVRERYLANEARKQYYSMTEYYLDIFKNAAYLDTIAGSVLAHPASRVAAASS